jgi:hypothetical protein
MSRGRALPQRVQPPPGGRDGKGRAIDISGATSRFGNRQDDLFVFILEIDECRRVWDYPTMILTLDAKRRLTLPATLAPAKPGDHFKAEFDPEEDILVFRRVAKRADWLAVLKACPVDMDDLPPRRRQYPRKRKL